jgi:hypothetical protein
MRHIIRVANRNDLDDISTDDGDEDEPAVEKAVKKLIKHTNKGIIPQVVINSNNRQAVLARRIVQ